MRHMTRVRALRGRANALSVGCLVAHKGTLLVE